MNRYLTVCILPLALGSCAGNEGQKEAAVI